MRPSEVRRCVVRQLVLSACGRGCVCAFGVCGLLVNVIGDEGCAALARALEGGAVPQLSTLDLRGMFFGVSVLEGLWCERSAACV